MLGWRGKRKPTPNNGRTDAQSNNIRPPFPKASRDGRFSDAAWRLNDSVYTFVMESHLGNNIKKRGLLREFQAIMYDWTTPVECGINLTLFIRELDRDYGHSGVMMTALNIMARSKAIRLDADRVRAILEGMDHGLISESEAWDSLSDTFRPKH